MVNTCLPMRLPPLLPSLLLLLYLVCGIYLFIEIRGERVDGLVLFSAVKGRLLDHGEPVVGARIERETSWNMEKETRLEFTITDAEGRFSFPEMKGSARFGLMHRYFHIPVVLESLFLLGDSKPTMLYTYGRSTYQALEETGLSEIELDCDLRAQRSENEFFSRLDCPVRTHPDRKKP